MFSKMFMSEMFMGNQKRMDLKQKSVPKLSASDDKRTKRQGPFLMSVNFIWIEKIFHILLILTLCFNQVAWAMENPHSGDPERRVVRPLLQGLSTHLAGDEEKSAEGSLEAGLLAFTENEATTTTVVTVEAARPQGDREINHRNGGLSHMEGDSSLPTVLIDETRSVSHRHSSRLHVQEEPTREELASQTLQQIETSWWRNSLRWATGDSLLQKVGYALALRRNAVLDTPRCCSPPVWLSGGSYPIASQQARRYVLFVDGFRQGAEFVIFRTIHTGITVLTLYQLYNYFDQTPPLLCQNPSTAGDLGSLFEFMKNSEDKVLLGIFHDILGKQSNALPYLRYLLAAPLMWGMGKGLWNARKSDLSSEEIGEILEEIAQIKPGIGNDIFRWILPLHPINRNFSMVMKNLLWNPTVSKEDLDKIWDSLETLGRRPGYTPIYAMGEMMKIAYGMNARDLRLFKPEMGEEMPLMERAEGSSLSSTLDDRLRIKDQAFSFLQEMADFGNTKKHRTVGGKVQTGITALYAKYLLWSLGAPPSRMDMMASTLFKGGKLYVQAKLVQLIIETFLEAEKCPEQPGVSVAGVEPWASDLTQECFEASVKIFNLIPGQPTSTLVGNLDQYYFPNCTVDLDLSGKGLDGKTVANITQALLNHSITFTFLNLSGNAINMPEDFNALFPSLRSIIKLDLSNNLIGDTTNSSEVIALAQGLSYLTNLQFLDLSDNNMALINSNGTIALAQGLFHLTNLQSLDLSYSFIGQTDSNGIVALGKGLSALTNLQFLDLSWTAMSYRDSIGTIALAQGLSYLTNLQFLDLSHNWIGWTYSSGTVALGKGLPALTNLQFLGLSGNEIDSKDSNGTVALGKGLSALTNLQLLDLSYNEIGSTDSNGTAALGKGLSALTNLQSFNLSNNRVGWTDSSGTVALGKGLSALTNLRLLDLSENDIGSTDSNGTVALGKGLSALTNLQFLGLSGNEIGHEIIQPLISILYNFSYLKIFLLLPQGNTEKFFIPSSITYEDILKLNEALEYTLSPPLLPVLSSLEDVEVFCSSLSPTINNVTLSGSMFTLCNSQNLPKVLTALLNCLQQIPHLTALDLSYNNIESLDSSGTIALAQGLSYLTNLQFLDLSDNKITSVRRKRG